MKKLKRVSKQNCFWIKTSLAFPKSSIIILMIVKFSFVDTERVYRDGKSRKFQNRLIAKFLYYPICIDKSIANMLVKYPS